MTTTTHDTVNLMRQLATALTEMMAGVPGMELEPVARRKWEHTLQNMDEILDELRCACGQPIAGLQHTEFVCQSCLDKWVTCAACGNDLLLAAAETPDGAEGVYHHGCIGRDGEL